MIKMGLQNIFSVPIYTTILNDRIVKYMKNLIIPKLTNLEFKGHQRTDFFKKTKTVLEKDLFPFFKVLDYVSKEYSKISNIVTSDSINYWIQDYSKNESHPLHNHTASYISGIYYIRANKHAGDLRFLNPNPLTYFTKFVNSNKETTFFYVKPQPGLLLLFPSWLSHEVFPSNSKKCVRTSLAFNFI